MDPRELLIANLALVERVVAYTCRRQRLNDDDAEEFASVVKLKLVENDYGILRKFEGRSSFSTFLTVVVQRMLLDYRIHFWGKWHPSAEAKRLGDTAVQLERLLHRDSRTIDDALGLLHGDDETITRQSLEALAAKLPTRKPKRKLVELDAATDVAAPSDAATLDQHKASARVSSTMRRFIDSLPQEDRLVLQLRFDAAMSVAEIARSLRLDAKQLYRRIEKRFDEVRQQLIHEGVGVEEIRDLIGARGVVLDFDLRKTDGSPSLNADRPDAGKEGISR